MEVGAPPGPRRSGAGVGPGRVALEARGVDAGSGTPGWLRETRSVEDRVSGSLRERPGVARGRWTRLARSAGPRRVPPGARTKRGRKKRNLIVYFARNRQGSFLSFDPLWNPGPVSGREQTSRKLLARTLRSARASRVTVPLRSAPVSRRPPATKLSWSGQQNSRTPGESHPQPPRTTPTSPWHPCCSSCASVRASHGGTPDAHRPGRPRGGGRFFLGGQRGARSR